jgi:uroporphyrinogen-III synthase
MRGKCIALLESRLGDQLAELVSRAGGVPLQAPALAEVPEAYPRLLGIFLDECVARPADLFVFQTGVGTRALLEVAESLGRLPELLQLIERAKVAVRGPKPTAVLRSRSVRIDIAAPEPHTTVELKAQLAGLSLSGARVVVQRYGESNLELHRFLQERGADVVELPTYRWSLPDDTRPLAALLDAFEQARVDAVVFTSAIQVRNLFAFARGQGRGAVLRDGLDRALVVSIGPVCTRELVSAGVRVGAEASPPKLGPLMGVLRERL